MFLDLCLQGFGGALYISYYITLWLRDHIFHIFASFLKLPTGGAIYSLKILPDSRPSYFVNFIIKLHLRRIVILPSIVSSFPMFASCRHCPPKLLGVFRLFLDCVSCVCFPPLSHVIRVLIHCFTFLIVSHYQQIDTLYSL